MDDIVGGRNVSVSRGGIVTVVMERGVPQEIRVYLATVA